MLQWASSAWEWIQRRWLALLLPPAAFCLAAGVTGQVQRARRGAAARSWEGHFRRAALAESRSDRTSALAHLRRAEQTVPEQAEPHLQLAAAYESIALKGPAAEHLERALRLAEPRGAPQGYLAVVSEYCDLGRFDDAARVLREEVLPHQPVSAQARYFEGLVAFHQEKGEAGLRRALALLAECLHRDPRHTQARFYYAEVQAQLGNLPEAARAYRLVLQRNPFSSAAHFALASALRRAGKAGEADRALAEARRVDARQRRIGKLEETHPGQLRADELLELGTAYLQQRQPDRAIEALNHLTWKRPADALGHRLLAEAYRAAGQPDNARVERELAAGLDGRADRRR